MNRSPKWWRQEVYHGVLLCLEMLRQPEFLVLAVYTGWVYAQVVLTTIFLASLLGVCSVESVHLRYAVLVVAAGALASIPFQMGNASSRSRYRLDGSRGTEGELLVLTLHSVRRAAFTLLLPLFSMGYTITSDGPPTPIAWPIALAGCIGFLGCLTVSERSTLILETFDLSDLGLNERDGGFMKDGPLGMLDSSSLMRVTAGFTCFYTVAFALAAVATAVGGVMRGSLEQRVTMWIVAGFMMLLTLLILLVLYPIKEVRVEGSPEVRPRSRRSTVARLPDTKDGLKPGSSNDTARMSIFGLGSMTRWTFANDDITARPTQSLDTLFTNLPRPPSPVVTTSSRGEEVTGTTGAALGTTVTRKERSRSVDGTYGTWTDHPGGTGNRKGGLVQTERWMRQHGAKSLRGRDVDVAHLRG